MKLLRVILVKPSKYGLRGYVERFKKGFMPNATLHHIASLTPKYISNHKIDMHLVDEYVWCNRSYLDQFQFDRDSITLIALVGVQSHQFQRALDLAAFAKRRGVEHCVIGGPHVMTCKTHALHDKGVSFALSEAENIWLEILNDAVEGELKSVYGLEQRWARTLKGTVIKPPLLEDLNRYWAPMLGLYPVRGCPYNCNFCSVIKISGRQVRSESIDTTMQSLLNAQKAGIDTVMFVSDNFNKFPNVEALLTEMIKAKLNLRYFCQCDTKVASQHDLLELLGKSNCFEMFVGIESFDRDTLKNVNKFHNNPGKYQDIVNACNELGIRTHFSNIIGFPNQSKRDIYDHMDWLKQLKPKVASFYILTPIPGTDQYDDFLRDGLICETNLDRFDATYPTFRHGYLSKEELLTELYDCYVQYNRFLLRNVKLDDESKRLAIFNRYTAGNMIHPMAGGIDRVSLDLVDEYLPLRKEYYGIEQVGLSASLKLSAEDQEINRTAKLMYN